jgi:hypothetical protein
MDVRLMSIKKETNKKQSAKGAKEEVTKQRKLKLLVKLATGFLPFGSHKTLERKHLSLKLEVTHICCFATAIR